MHRSRLVHRQRLLLHRLHLVLARLGHCLQLQNIHGTGQRHHGCARHAVDLRKLGLHVAQPILQTLEVHLVQVHGLFHEGTHGLRVDTWELEGSLPPLIRQPIHSSEAELRKHPVDCRHDLRRVTESIVVSRWVRVLHVSNLAAHLGILLEDRLQKLLGLQTLHPPPSEDHALGHARRQDGLHDGLDHGPPEIHVQIHLFPGPLRGGARGLDGQGGIHQQHTLSKHGLEPLRRRHHLVVLEQLPHLRHADGLPHLQLVHH
mmetsp:Transcript_8343/g.18243  ORF Transcript_8343/g.18243 Transcript_8343/m.18243 type:complete len:260 (-) Transcript_8343:1428-2207(-)